MPDSYGCTPLWYACQEGDLASVKRRGAKDDVTKADDKYDQTPMWIACRYNNLNIMQWLYDNGAKDDVTKADNEGLTPMWITTTLDRICIRN